MEAIRCLKAGRSLSAVVITRAQIERWTVNIAEARNLVRTASEDDQEFIARVWSDYLTPEMGRLWAELSELIHARGPLVAAFQHEALAAWGTGKAQYGEQEYDQMVLLVTEVLSSVQAHIMGCLKRLAGESEVNIAALLDSRPQWPDDQDEDILDFTLGGRVTSSHPLAKTFFAPVEFLSLDRHDAQVLQGWTEAHRKALLGVSALEELGQADAFYMFRASNCIYERRARAFQRARKAFENEAEELAGDYDPGKLLAALFRYSAFSSVATLLATWSEGKEREALTAAGCALRSAVNLWLEDSDHSLSAMRVVLEQTSRARAHRLKPSRAARQDENPRGGGSRWLELAGWKRGGPLFRALSEFSHISLRSRFDGGRAFLYHATNDSLEDRRRLHSTRTTVLEAGAYMLALELAQRLAEVDVKLQQSFSEHITLIDLDRHVALQERYWEQIRGLREFDFGPPLAEMREDPNSPEEANTSMPSLDAKS
ncbi:hypothetical protein [Aquipuribacter sp. MA13-6]|uniref:hypothetical protein n=1 Tax=unclassified Aquipuribacter TaxID=2635084 RepID=UPI003EEBDA14